MNQTFAQEKFFKAVYAPVLINSENLSSGKIRVFQKTKDNQTHSSYFQNIGELISHCNKTSRTADTYFSLSVTNGNSGQASDLRVRTVLGFDFDDGLTASDVMLRFTQSKLYFHALVASGNGFHAYLFIEPETDHDKVERVQKAMCKALGADENAAKVTQILRVPNTYNLKDAIKRVNTVKLYNIDTIRRYDIDRLAARFCTDKNQSNITATFLTTTNTPPCIEEMIRTGSIEGSRNANLMNLVVTLRKRGKTLPQIMQLAERWAFNSNYDDSLAYRVKYIYEHQKNVQRDCAGCAHFATCFDKIESDFEFDPDYVLMEMSETHMKRLKQGAQAMESHDLMIYGVLKLHKDGLTVDGLMREITYKGNAALSERTVRKALKNLEENGFIITFEDGSSHKKTYIIEKSETRPELKFYFSYAAVNAAVQKQITPEELRVYTYMRYLHHRQQRFEETQLKGNLFQCNQIKIAEDLGITQGRVSQIINKLLEEHIITIWHRQPSKNNGFDFNIYRLCY